MAIRIISPQFSFVRFSDQQIVNTGWYESPLPGVQLGFSIPVSVKTDLAFQFIVEADTDIEAEEVCQFPTLTGFNIKINNGPIMGPAFTSGDFAALATAQYALSTTLERYRISTTQVLFYVPLMDLLDLSILQAGQCFQIALQVIRPVIPITMQAHAISNVFRYIGANTNYTSLLEYDSEMDEVGFTYEPSATIKNKVRLPMYFTRPTLPEDESVHRRSDGTLSVIKAVIRKQYEAVVDILPIWAIEAIRAMWIHDTVQDSAKGELVKEGAFEIEYLDYLNYPLGRSKFKVSVSPYVLRKNNCGEPTDYSGLIVMGEIHLGTYIPAHTYNIDLDTAIISQCCGPLSYFVDYYQFHLIFSISIAGNMLTLTTRPTPLSFPTPPPFVRIKAMCGGITTYTTVVVP